MHGETVKFKVMFVPCSRLPSVSVTKLNFDKELCWRYLLLLLLQMFVPLFIAKSIFT